MLANFSSGGQIRPPAIIDLIKNKNNKISLPPAHDRLFVYFIFLSMINYMCLTHYFLDTFAYFGDVFIEGDKHMDTGH